MTILLNAMAAVRHVAPLDYEAPAERLRQLRKLYAVAFRASDWLAADRIQLRIDAVLVEVESEHALA